MGRQRFDSSGQKLRLLRRIVDAVDHGILKGDPPTGPPIVFPALLKQRVHAPPPVGRHKAAAGLVVRRVEGYRQRQLQIPIGQIVKSLQDPAGGKGDMPHADVFPFG